MEFYSLTLSSLVYISAGLVIISFILYLFIQNQKSLNKDVPLLENLLNYKSHISFRNLGGFLFILKNNLFKPQPGLTEFGVGKKGKPFKVDQSISKKSLGLGLLTISIFFLLLILLGPKGGENKISVNAKGVDVVYAIDVSKSMNAEDFTSSQGRHSRLNAAKYMIANYVTQNIGNRYGGVIFSGEAFTAIPLTSDGELFLTFLDSISAGSVSKGGTNLTEAISSSLSRFISGEDRAKIIILISDGGDERDDTDFTTIKRMIEENGVQVFTVGIGTTKGAHIPEGRDFFGRTSYITYEGNKVISSLYEMPLKKIASYSGGKYFKANSLDSLEKINEEIKDSDLGTITKKVGEGKMDLFRYFVGISFIFYLFAIII